MEASGLTTSARRRFFLVKFVCVLMIYTVGYSAAPEIGPESTLSTSQRGYQIVMVNSEHQNATKGGATKSRHIHRRATFGESNSTAWRRTFKFADYGDNTVVVISGDGTGQYRSIQDAIDQVPEHNTNWTIMYITSGVYKEKVIIPITKPYITLQGAGRNRTVITWNDTAAAAGTLMSASVVVESDHFIARDISFENSAGPPTRNKMNMQAAAFRISGDMAILYRCNFFGYQDTLYDHQGRHYYLGCFIEGSEDFIFGFARSLFERCWLHSIAEGKGGALVAQGKYYPGSIMGPSGYSFLSCIITGTGRPYLGRAWGQYSTVVYSYCQMDANIIPQGWYDWGLPERDRTAYFGQYRCTGRGANSTGRVRWAKELTDEEAQPFLGLHYIDGPW